MATDCTTRKCVRLGAGNTHRRPQDFDRPSTRSSRRNRSSRNRPGALFALLEPFQRGGVSLTRIDSRPSRTEKWAYVFFIEFEGHLQDDNIAAILAELEEQSIMLKALGSYPRAVL